MSQLDGGSPAELLSATHEAMERCQETTALESPLSSLSVLSQQAVEEATSIPRYDEHVHACLKDLIFVGPPNTDLDSAEGAKSAAALFWRSPRDSRAKLEWRNPLRTHEVQPLLFDQIVGAKRGEGAKTICLVVHTQVKQMTKILRDEPQCGRRIGVVIDNHAFAETMGTSNRIFVGIRPWRSMSTIVLHLFLAHQRLLRREIAKILLLAILSDTLSHRSATTTDADRETVPLLARFPQVDDPSDNCKR